MPRLDAVMAGVTDASAMSCMNRRVQPLHHLTLEDVMATWSKSQSQDAGCVRAVSSGLKVSSSTDLVRCEKIRLANQRENKRIIRWSEEAPTYKKIREYDHTIEVKLPRRNKRGTSGCRMSHEKRALVLQRAFDREKFFAALES